MKKSLIVSISVLLIVFIACGAFLCCWYLISGKTFRAVASIVQGFDCHFAAILYRTVGLNSTAIKVQNLSIQGYENADENLESDELKALIFDEMTQLSTIYSQSGDQHSSLLCVERMEKFLRLQIKRETHVKNRWQKALTDVLLYEARVLYNQKLYAQALQKYDEVILICSGSVGDDAVMSENLANAKKECAGLKQYLH